MLTTACNTIQSQSDTPQVDNSSVVVCRIKYFYMGKCNKIWEDLARYEAEATVRSAARYSMDASLLAAVIVTESDGYPFARSRTGAKGPGQVDFKAHKDRFPHIVEERDKYDPAKNIECAAGLLSEYIKTHGNVENALQAYNVGETAFRRGVRAPGYVRTVLSNQHDLNSK